MEAFSPQFPDSSVGTLLAVFVMRGMKTGELIRRLEAAGWYRVRQSGSHAVYRHRNRSGQLTVPVHLAKEVPRGTLAKLLKSAGIE
jgi:predicted RNA binding protein YcfA (HicA-like mRNA interferase family)